MGNGIINGSEKPTSITNMANKKKKIYQTIIKKMKEHPLSTPRIVVPTGNANISSYTDSRDCEEEYNASTTNIIRSIG